MPYPRVCPCCSAHYPDDRSHISLCSQERQGRRVVELLCLTCRGSYQWDFGSARVFVEPSLPAVDGDPNGRSFGSSVDYSRQN